MSMAELVHRLGRLLALVVLGFAGVYVIVYLLRWEWNRALIAGVFFLAAEVFLVADLVLGRLRRIHEQLEYASDAEQISALAAELRRHRPPPRGPFPWLSPDQDRTYVLVPILLGAGVILSGIAYVVERLSRVTAAPVAEHELARGLASMALPRTGLSPTGQPPVTPLDRPREAPNTERRNGIVIAGLVVSLTAVIVTLAIVLVTRPGPAQEDEAMIFELAVERNNLDQRDEAVLTGLWSVCELRMPQEVALQDIRPAAQGEATFELEVAPAPSEFDKREFMGCLQDAVVDRASARLLGITVVPR